MIAAGCVVSGWVPAFTVAGKPATVRKTFNFDTSEWCKVE